MVPVAARACDYARARCYSYAEVAGARAVRYQYSYATSSTNYGSGN